jgi:hypothetical protein
MRVCLFKMCLMQNTAPSGPAHKVQCIPRVQQCLSPRRNWPPPHPLSPDPRSSNPLTTTGEKLIAHCLLCGSALSYCAVGLNNELTQQVCKTQRVLKDLQRTRLSRHHTIWLLPDHLPTSPPASLSFSVFLWVAGRAYEGLVEEPNYTTARKPGPL